MHSIPKNNCDGDSVNSMTVLSETDVALAKVDCRPKPPSLPF